MEVLWTDGDKNRFISHANLEYGNHYLGQKSGKNIPCWYYFPPEGGKIRIPINNIKFIENE